MTATIAGPEYRHLPGPVGKLLEGTYSTTVSVPMSPSASLVYTTGHIGLDLNTGSLVHDSLEAEFNAIFDCLDAALKNHGVSEGCGQAFRFVSYLLSPDLEPTMQSVFKKRWPGHQPTWVTVIVKEVVGGGAMSAEIAAEAAVYSNF